MNRRVLIIGGYGTFGGRLARLLADEPSLTLVLAGRSPAKAQAFAATLGARSKAEALAFDRDGDVAAQLAAAGPDLVIDASGPFQAYGEDPYRVVQAALALGVPYLDLADGADFVLNIAAFDAEARERGVFVLSGVSSVPLLTAAAADRLAEGMARVESIAGGIAPSPHAVIGEAVVRAIAGYAGKPVRLVRDGAPATATALVDTRRVTIAPPGHLPLRNTLFALVASPDLTVLPRLWPGLRSVWFGSGVRPEALLRALTWMARLVQWRALPSLSALAPLFHRCLGRLRWGERRGGMFVAVSGIGLDGAAMARSWHMIAEGDHGQMIPAMPAAALVRRWLAGASPEPGARPATRELDLEAFEAIVAGRPIVTGIHDDSAGAADSLTARILGPAFAALPAAVRAMHSPAVASASGRASVEGARGGVARLVARLSGFPPSAADIPVQVAFMRDRVGAAGRDGFREVWRRRFGAQTFASTLTEGRGRFARLAVERFGPFRFGLAFVLADGVHHLVVRRWTAFGVPMPRALAPAGSAREYVEDGRFSFDVEIVLPLVGRLVRYRGWLVPDPQAEPTASASRSFSV